MELLYQIVFCSLAFIFALLAIESKNIVRSVSYFLLFSVVIGVMIYLLGAPYVAVFQLLVYGGGVSVLFLAVVYTLGGNGGK